jgi:hypothetical protein
MYDELLEFKTIDDVEFRTYYISGGIIRIDNYRFASSFNIENENELKIIAKTLKSFIKYLQENDMLAKETDEEDARKIDVMNEIIKLVKGY